MGNQKMGPQVAYQSETECVEPDCSLLAQIAALADCENSRPAHRSLGGYLDYTEWPDRERFIGLDCAIRRQVQEGHNTDNHSDSDDPQVLRPLQRCSAALGNTRQCKNKFRMTPPDTNCKAIDTEPDHRLPMPYLPKCAGAVVSTRNGRPCLKSRRTIYPSRSRSISSNTSHNACFSSGSAERGTLSPLPVLPSRAVRMMLRRSSGAGCG